MLEKWRLCRSGKGDRCIGISGDLYSDSSVSVELLLTEKNSALLRVLPPTAEAAESFVAGGKREDRSEAGEAWTLLAERVAEVSVDNVVKGREVCSNSSVGDGGACGNLKSGCKATGRRTGDLRAGFRIAGDEGVERWEIPGLCLELGDGKLECGSLGGRR